MYICIHTHTIILYYMLIVFNHTQSWGADSPLRQSQAPLVLSCLLLPRRLGGGIVIVIIIITIIMIMMMIIIVRLIVNK